MRPIAILNGILLGSSVAICLSCAVTLFIVFLMRGESQHLATELLPMALFTGSFAVVSAICALALYGHLRERAWRWHAQIGVVSIISVVAFVLYSR